VCCLRGGKGGPDLVGELPLLPERARLVDELFQLGRDVPEPGRRPERDPVRPLEIVERRDRRLGDLGAVPAPVLVLRDQQLGGELVHVPQPNLRSGALGALGQRPGETVHVAGGAVVDDRAAGSLVHRAAAA
jgi:hypothetical protein